LNRKEVTIVGFGDSITEAIVGMPNKGKRWLNILNEQLNDRFPDIYFRTINSGVGGNSDREKMIRFEKDVLTHNPDFLLLEFGGNNNDFQRPERLVSPEQTMEYLEQIKNRISSKTKIILITFPYVIENLHAVYTCVEKTDTYFEYFNEFGGVNGALEFYREKCRKFAQKYDLPVINLDVIMRKIMNPDTLTMKDGVHLTEEGNRLVAKLVFNTIKSLTLLVPN
jgi:lysophospholipase L1-like esterase